jgi:3-oxoadipate enol-lactonase
MDLAQEFSCISYRGDDGCSLHAWSIGPALPGISTVPVLLLHGGGPDHEMFVPLAKRLALHHQVILPDIRGYGRSVCADPARHKWAQYVADVVSLQDHLSIETAVLGGAGLGATVSMRLAVAHPGRIRAMLLVSVEDIEDDEAKAAEIQLLDEFAERVRSKGILEAWRPLLGQLAPLIGTLVREAIPRSTPASIAAAAAIGHDRSFRHIGELSGIATPTLIFPGMDFRHPATLAKTLADLLPRGQLADVGVNESIRNAEELARVFAPPIMAFLADQAV